MGKRGEPSRGIGSHARRTRSTPSRRPVTRQRPRCAVPPRAHGPASAGRPQSGARRARPGGQSTRASRDRSRSGASSASAPDPRPREKAAAGPPGGPGPGAPAGPEALAVITVAGRETAPRGAPQPHRRAAARRRPRGDDGIPVVAVGRSPPGYRAGRVTSHAGSSGPARRPTVAASSSRSSTRTWIS